MKISAALLSSFLVTVTAQQSAYGQCGGYSWTGATTCVSGNVCTYLNEWYSQCLPGSASTTTSLFTATTTTAPHSSSSTTVSTSIKPTSTGASTFPTAVGTSFEIDGQVGYFAGTNAYWIGFLTNNSDVDLVMSHLQSSGIKILRVWGFNIATSTPSAGSIWYQSLVPGQAPAINTGATGLERLDYVVQSAEAHDIKLIINFNNNWSDYGGVPAYMTYYNLTQEQWYTNSTAQATYQTYIKAVMSRYTTSSAIFAWELMNEPRCHGCDVSVVYNWASATSKYIKSLDSTHMVTLGDEGFNPTGGDGTYPYTQGEGVSFSQNLNISTLDFGTFHCYPESWGTNDTTWVTEWIQTHAADCVAANKPCYLEEYGYNADPTVLAPWQQTALNTKGIAGDAFWQDGDTLSTGETSQDGNTIYYGTSQWTELVTDHVAAIAAKNGFS